MKDYRKDVAFSKKVERFCPFLAPTLDDFIWCMLRERAYACDRFRITN